MTVWHTPRTWNVGELVTKVMLDEQIRDNENYLKGETDAVAAAIAAAVSAAKEALYPVGFVVTLGVSTNPATLFGFGTWTAIAGKVIVGINAADAEFDTLNEAGGAKTHTLQVSETPTHGHSIEVETAAGGAMPYVSGGTTALSTTSENNVIGGIGGNAAHNNLQPYIVKYIWQRTA